MNRNSIPLLLFCMILLFAPLAAAAAPITIDTVPVGNPGNANDPNDGDSQTPGTQNFGAVAYAYRIGAYEVTNDQYAEFLSNKAASDPLNLYNVSMGNDARGGILRTGSSGSFSYTVKPDMGNKPVNNVNWYDAVRFANWLNNGQGSGDTETGAYTLLGGTPTPSNGSSITRNVGATWFLPSEDEWYKAAFHQPAAQGGDSDDYWLFPTASNSVPTVATANSVGDISNPGSNVVNYDHGADWNSQDGNVTTVGSAGPLSESFYGTSDQGGNVWEWNEALINGSSRGVRGGGYNNFLSLNLDSSGRDYSGPGYEPSFDSFGFRLATVPEPSSLVLAALGLLGALFGWRRQNGR